MKEIFHRPSQNIPALDGLRAFAIISVIGMHLSAYFHKFVGSETLFSSLPPFKGGWVGVPLFFVLSGYLIGKQIWNEFYKTNTINIKRFVIRRGIRIWPLYYIILFFFILFPVNEHVSLDGLISNLLFLSNYWSDNGPVPDVMWSLSTEEHFYILLPLIIILFKKVFRNVLKDYTFPVLLSLFFIPLILRVITWYVFLGRDSFDGLAYQIHIYRPFHTNCEGLIGGVIISFLEVRGKFAKIEAKRKDYLIGVIFLVIFLFSFLSKITLNFTGVALGFTYLLFFILFRESLLTYFLSWKGFFPIAKTSYCLYLIHTPVLIFYFKEIVRWIPLEGELLFILSFIIVLAICFILSVALFYLVEKPFLKNRKKLLDFFS